MNTTQLGYITNLTIMITLIYVFITYVFKHNVHIILLITIFYIIIHTSIIIQTIFNQKIPSPKGFKQGYKHLTHQITIITNYLILTTIYITIIGPTSLIMKTTGKQFYTNKRNTNWQTHKESNPNQQY